MAFSCVITSVARRKKSVKREVAVLPCPHWMVSRDAQRAEGPERLTLGQADPPGDGFQLPNVEPRVKRPDTNIRGGKDDITDRDKAVLGGDESLGGDALIEPGGLGGGRFEPTLGGCGSEDDTSIHRIIGRVRQKLPGCRIRNLDQAIAGPIPTDP
jgi:hypothetical protein